MQQAKPRAGAGSTGPARIEQQDGPASEALAHRPVRRWRARLFRGYLLAAVLLSAVLAFFVRRTVYSAAYFPIDLVVTQALQAYDPPWLVVLMRLVSWPGYGPQVVGVVAGLSGLLLLLGLRREGGIAALAGVSALAINHLLKLAVERPRPTPDLVRVLRELADFSFPSGHVMFYTAFFGFLGFLAFTLLRSSRRRSLLILLSGLLIALVGPSRIYLGNHWVSDVLVGYLLGSLVLAAAVQIYLKGRNA